MAVKIGDRLLLKENGEVVVLDQVIRRPKESEDRVPRERIHVKAAPPEMETWYKVHGLKSGATMIRPAGEFEQPAREDATDDGAESRIRTLDI